MSLILSALRGTNAMFRTSYTNKALTSRCLSSSTVLSDTEATTDKSEKPRDPTKDRSVKHTYETSIRYLASEAYRTTYGTNPVWKQYRRNHKGAIPPRKTRKTCIRYQQISTGNPCPICRDEYLVLDHRNTELLKQFISEHNGAILSYSKTGLCQKKHQELLVAIARAKNYGTITYDVPFRQYDYSEWYKPEPNA
ncbi:small ribosomal subunit protein mS40 [Neodiprion pinetum]|uniref:small ribosomal subunit protein mS40 n=1 Tax=Neodiprion pinetum TaxID=441929 RepID=UPI001EDD7731|nr:28S ribosomal protein S18b, mitochondrial [Neodiprion pinetum]